MTLETCKKRLELARERGNKEEEEFWKQRIIRKASKHAKYKGVNVEEFLGETKSKGKK